MATNTGGGTTTSLDNTVQAKDDFYLAMEDQILCFDVMANDLGGAAKTLWSIDETSEDGSADLICKDVVGVIEYSELGAKISLTSDGKIKYDASMLDYLAAGETATDHFTYAIRLSNGTLSWATVTVTLTGTNDAPDIFVGAGDDAGEIFAETNSPLSTSGTLSVVDPDTSDVVDTSASVAVSGNQGGLSDSDLLGMFSITGGTDNDLAADASDTNNLSWAFDSGSEAFDYLAAGESLTLTYTLTSDDGHGGSDTQDVVITINGTNDGPDIFVGAGDSDGANLDETDAALTASGTLSVVDPDTSDVVDTSASLAVSGNQGGLSDADLLAMFSITNGTDNDLAADASDASNLSWAFDSDSEAFDYLADGETLTLTYTLTSDDGHGGSDTQDVTIVITGTNDAAEITGDDAKEITEDDAPNTVSGDLNSTDVDGTDDAWDADTIAGAYGSLTINADGTWTYTLDNDNPDVDALNDDSDPLTDTITVKTEDGTAHDIVITINGHTDVTGETRVNDPADDKDFDDPSTVAIFSGATAHTGNFNGANGVNDVILGDGSGQTLNGLGGDDSIHGAGGNDTINGNNQGDTLYGGAGDDFINGGGGNDTIYGGSNNDTIIGEAGTETIYGGSGNDDITGSGGQDQLWGGTGQDDFIFLAGDTSLATRDKINDFSHAEGDHIDLSAFAGLTGASFVGAVGSSAAIGLNQVGYVVNGDGTLTVYADTDGNGTVDFAIDVAGVGSLQGSDFLF